MGLVLAGALSLLLKLKGGKGTGVSGGLCGGKGLGVEDVRECREGKVGLLCDGRQARFW